MIEDLERQRAENQHTTTMRGCVEESGDAATTCTYVHAYNMHAHTQRHTHMHAYICISISIYLYIYTYMYIYSAEQSRDDGATERVSARAAEDKMQRCLCLWLCL